MNLNMNKTKGTETPQARYRREQQEWREHVRASNLLPSAKVVLHALQEHQMQAKGTAWPGQDLLARECNMSKRTIAAALKEAREAGYIVAVGTKSTGGKYGSTVYRFTFPNDQVQPIAHGEAPNQVQPIAHGKPSPDAIQRNDRMQPIAHKPPSEPPIKDPPRKTPGTLTDEQMDILKNMGR